MKSIFALVLVFVALGDAAWADGCCIPKKQVQAKRLTDQYFHDASEYLLSRSSLRFQMNMKAKMGTGTIDANWRDQERQKVEFKIEKASRYFTQVYDDELAIEITYNGESERGIFQIVGVESLPRMTRVYLRERDIYGDPTGKVLRLSVRSQDRGQGTTITALLIENATGQPKGQKIAVRGTTTISEILNGNPPQTDLKFAKKIAPASGSRTRSSFDRQLEEFAILKGTQQHQEDFFDPFKNEIRRSKNRVITNATRQARETRQQQRAGRTRSPVNARVKTVASSARPVAVVAAVKAPVAKPTPKPKNVYEPEGALKKHVFDIATTYLNSQQKTQRYIPAHQPYELIVLPSGEVEARDKTTGKLIKTFPTMWPGVLPIIWMQGDHLFFTFHDPELLVAFNASTLDFDHSIDYEKIKCADLLVPEVKIRERVKVRR